MLDLNGKLGYAMRTSIREANIFFFFMLDSELAWLDVIALYNSGLEL